MRDRLLGARLPRATPNTITDPGRLAAVLAQARQDGIATISIAHPPTEPPERLAVIEAAIRLAAQRLSRALGGDPPS